ncbi:MAG: aquaporin [Nocardioides sp.]|nr:aquaporin [Nocardioides sp.]
MSDTTTAQKVAAELLGTFLLVFLGCGAAVMSEGSYLGTALAFGLALLVGVSAFGRVSGAHFNPAVSVGAAISGRMSWGQVPVYAGAQVLGGIVAAALLWVVVRAIPAGAVPDQTLGQNSFGDGGLSWWGALLVEIVLTAVLVTVVLAVTDTRNEHPSTAPLTIGVTLVAVYLFALPLTGGSVNPARSIGPALFTGTDSIKDLWLFVVAPVVGAAVAGLAYPAVLGHGTEPVPGSGLALGRPAAGAAVPGYGLPDQFQQEWSQQEGLQPAVFEPEPIIQDGWQWDHQAQEWQPLEQWTTALEAQASGSSDTAVVDTDPGPSSGPASESVTERLPQQSWVAGSDDTQIRPRDT